MKFPILSLVWLLIILVAIVLMCFQNKNCSDYLSKLSDSKTHKFPFRYFKDEHGKILPIVAVTGFFRSKEDRERYNEYKNNGVKIFGITAYKSFPKRIDDVSEDKFHHSDDFNYTKEIKNWLCCFQNAPAFGFTSWNKLSNQSESDFYDADNKPESTDKKYDFIYICNKDDDKCNPDGWNALNRNFKLALECFPILINKMGMKGLIVGRVHCGLESLYGNNIEVTGFLPYHELQAKMKQSRFLFLPNITDASPRVIAECMIKNVPVLMNRNILCGTKYVNPKTGTLFTDKNDVASAAQRLLQGVNSGQITPKTWWRENYGVKISAKRLKGFLSECFPNVFAKYPNSNEITFVI